MREPPRLNAGEPPHGTNDPRFGGFGPSERFGGDGLFGNGPASRDLPPNRRSPGTTLAVAFGVTFLVLFVTCGGLFAWIYASFNSPSTMSAQYREHREPLGGAMPQEIIDTLNSSAPQSGEEIASLEQFLEEIADGDVEDAEQWLDYERIVKEIKDSGLAVGINPLTHFLWVENLRESFGLPELGDENCIVDVRWLIPDVEARATVVSYNSWDDKPTVYLLYLTRARDRWKLFDFRDVLSPLSESQFFAVYSAAPVHLSGQYHLLSEELLEISGDYTASQSERAQKSLQSFNRRKYPEDMLPLAQALTAHYLLMYEDVPTLEQLTEDFSGDRFAGAHYIRARLALLQENKPDAMRHATALVQSVGWHPAAAILAAEAAESPEAKRQAADWLLRSLALAPSHSGTLTPFFAVADEAKMRQLIAGFAGRPDGQLRLLRMIDSMYQPARRRRLAALVDPKEPFALAAGYLQMLVARDEGRTEEMLTSAASLLKQPEIAEVDAELQSHYETTVSTVAWESLLSATNDAKYFDSAWAAAPDRSEFTRRYRDRIIENWYVETDWPRALRILQQLPADSELLDEVETRIAIGTCYHQLKQYDDAFEQLIAPIPAGRDALLGIDSYPAYGYTWMRAAATAAIETERMLEFAEALDEPEAAFLILHSVLSSDQQQAEAEQLQSWYRDQPDAPPLWLEYFAAELAYARGDWHAADAALARAIELGEDDERLAEYDLPSLTYTFVPFSEDLSEWLTTRLERAFRCGRLTELMRTLEQQDQLTEYTPLLSWLLPRYEDIEAQLELVEQLADNRDEDVVAFTRTTRQHHAEKQGDYDSAIDLLLATAKDAETRGEYYASSSFNSLVELMTASGSFERLEELRELARDADDRATLQALLALQAGDAEAFLAAMESYESDYYRRLWLQSAGRIGALQRANLWDDVNQHHAGSLGWLAADYAATGLIVLDAPASQAIDPIAASIEGLSPQGFTALPVESFPQAVAAWSTETEAGRLIAVAYDEPAGSERGNEELTRLHDNHPGFICFALMQAAGAPPPTEPLRRMAAGVGEALPTAEGYHDFTSESWFTGPDWLEQLRQAVSHGVNRRAPMESYLTAPDVEPSPDDEQKRLRVVLGLIVESIPVHADPQESPEAGPSAQADALVDVEASEKVLVLERTPFLVPFLPSGARVLE